MICYQSTNKPAWVRGLTAPVNRSQLNWSAHLVYVLVTLGAFPLDYLSGKLPKPVLLSYRLLIYISDPQVVVFHPQDSLFSHRTNSQVLLLPFIHYHMVSISTSLLIYNIHFSVGNSYNTYFLVLFYTSALSGVVGKTDCLPYQSPGAP